MRFKNDIMRYLPDYYHDIEEFKEISQALNNELDELGKAVERLFANQYIGSLTIEGIRRHEKMLSLTPDSDVESLDTRRKRILSALMTKPPFTHEFFVNYYNIILGEGEWTEDADLEAVRYELFINYAVRAFYKEIDRFLDKTLPLHVDYCLYIISTELLNLNTGLICVSSGEVVTKMKR